MQYIARTVNTHWFLSTTGEDACVWWACSLWNGEHVQGWDVIIDIQYIYVYEMKQRNLQFYISLPIVNNTFNYMFDIPFNFYFDHWNHIKHDGVLGFSCTQFSNVLVMPVGMNQTR